MNKGIIEDTFAECFSGKYIRALITAEDDETLKKAAYDSTSTPGAVIGRIEGGVERFVGKNETPDGRKGVIVQYWFGLDDLEKFELELSYRIRQDILVKPFTRMFSYPKESDSKGSIGTMKQVGHCGDGYEWIENKFDREMINVPIAVPDFQIESKLVYDEGIMGANFWYMCKTKEAVLGAGELAIDAIMDVEGAISPFGICSAASKTETNYPWIGPTTNHPFCPSLKKDISEISKVPDSVNYIPEIVINGTDMEIAKLAMKNAIESILDSVYASDIVKISAGNFNGKLGQYNINLLDLF
ncbi:formylmethanofuran--tetrahydromethanopterin N-formyltransferase [Methanobrevibacter sp. TMH8]|uniref:formylmethanofuran--tetrahydromethanopterin N-formyltransferase n=1 Tax=Methanobrevibacter sp. TMH8 TaxID=2848611 RepID=UPI001CCA86BB|nr:formylmethanofuran--tetrahydromethanopterin N-formyltransferase [Methanobrevibacter sp. TMH8]MBZ9571340.1 formylmethanofuran--tetrahydromethanopterin N-formyltransferase [Methanobrevibacter sp. TMH8]